MKVVFTVYESRFHEPFFTLSSGSHSGDNKSVETDRKEVHSMVRTVGRSVVDIGRWVQDVIFRPAPNMTDSDLRDLNIARHTNRPQEMNPHTFFYVTYPRY